VLGRGYAKRIKIRKMPEKSPNRRHRGGGFDRFRREYSMDTSVHLGYRRIPGNGGDEATAIGFARVDVIERRCETGGQIASHRQGMEPNVGYRGAEPAVLFGEPRGKVGEKSLHADPRCVGGSGHRVVPGRDFTQIVYCGDELGRMAGGLPGTLSPSAFRADRHQTAAGWFDFCRRPADGGFWHASPAEPHYSDETLDGRIQLIRRLCPP
jgi:hypothetical protein